jgi:hypothetical protein
MTNNHPTNKKLFIKFITKQFTAQSNCYLKNGNDENWRKKRKAFFGEFLMAVKLNSCVKHHVPRRYFGKNNTILLALEENSF